MAIVIAIEELVMGQPTKDDQIDFIAKNFDLMRDGQVVSHDFTYKGDSWKLETWKSATQHDLVHMNVRLELITKPSVEIIVGVECPADPTYNGFENVFFLNGNRRYDEVAVRTFKKVSPVRDLKLEIQLVHMDAEWYSSSIIDYFLKGFQTEKFGDVTIVAKDGKKFRCERLFLSRSEVFRQMLSPGMKDSKENVVNSGLNELPTIHLPTKVFIEDFDGEIVAQLVLFLHNDECQIDKVAVDQLYAAAHKYQVDQLKIECETVLATNLSFETIVNTYRLANLYNSDKLLAKCVDFLATNKFVMSLADLVVESMKIGDGNEGQLKHKLTRMRIILPNSNLFRFDQFMSDLGNLYEQMWNWRKMWRNLSICV